MDVNSNQLVLLDNFWGDKGYGAWIVPLNWVVLPYLVYQIYPIFSQPSRFYNSFGSPLMFWGIGISMLLFMIMLLVFSIVFFKQALKTAQRIEYNMESLTVRLYYGREVIFSPGEITNIEDFDLRGLDKIITPRTPLSRAFKNYKIILENDFYFLVSGNMPGISKLVDSLRCHLGYKE